jgi:hypothetical protein
MNESGWDALIRELGFRKPERGKLLRHALRPPSLYFNRHRDGSVYFTGYRRDLALYDRTLWLETAAQQKKDDRAELMTLLPVAGDEGPALWQLLHGRMGEEARDGFAEQQIAHRPDLGPAQRRALISARHGQGEYRSAVEALEQACRVTGLLDRRHLRASHIKPWRVSTDAEKLDGQNGLLLSPHFDQLFARGDISFGDDGALRISKHLNPAVPNLWNLKGSINVGPFSAEQRVYLAYHRERVFEKDRSGTKKGE